MPLTIKDLMARMPQAFLPEKAGETEAVIQFNFTGDQESNWVAIIEGRTCSVEERTDENPTLTLTADGQDYVDVITGKVDGMQAFMKGKLKLKGDLNLAMKMMNFFKLN